MSESDVMLLAAEMAVEYADGINMIKGEEHRITAIAAYYIAFMDSRRVLAKNNPLAKPNLTEDERSSPEDPK